MDQYDKAIEFLSQNPSQIWIAWNHPNQYIAGCLFKYCSKDGDSDSNYGCLTQVAHGDYVVEDSLELTEQIKADKRIPTSHNITIESLPVFAEWQRKLDKHFETIN